MKKKLLSAALSICMLMGVSAAMPENAFTQSTSITASAEIPVYGDYEYLYATDGILLHAYHGKGGHVDIPTVIEGKPVVGLHLSLFKDRSDITSVTIPKTVLTIYGEAFSGTSIKSIELPEGLKGIYYAAFRNCKQLESITIPSKVEDLNAYLFDGCTALKTVDIKAKYDELYSGVFQNCKSLEKFTIPDGVTGIGSDAFNGCTKLKDINIPSSVRYIGEKAFANCSGFTVLTFPNQYATIKSDAFDNCKNLSFICYEFSQAEGIAKQNGYKYVNIDRLSGNNRYETAVEISRESPHLRQSDNVVLAYDLNYADALAGVPLAYNLDDAPILLTDTKTIDQKTLKEIKHLGAKNIKILGGEGVIGKEVVDALVKNGIKEKNIERIYGKSRFSTATAIAKKLNNKPTDVFFVYGLNYADALSVSTVAALKNAPIVYLTTDGVLDKDTKEYLEELKAKKCVKNAYVIGGEGVISNAMVSKAASALGKTPVRIAGADRYSTCVKVNTEFKDIFSKYKMYVATGTDFPDALAGGPCAARYKAPLFLVNGRSAKPELNADQLSYLKTRKPTYITVFGGEGAVPLSHFENIAKKCL